MRKAAMPGEDQQLIVRKHFAKDIGIGKDGTEHQGPGDYSRAIHGAEGKHVVAATNGFANQGAGDSVRDGVHGGSV
jgi:hypothetical protein